MVTNLDDENMEAEFDLLADNYYNQHKANLAITGEGPEYFSEYKVADFAKYFKNQKIPIDILDFGSGIGNSIEFFRKYFPGCKLCCADVSAKSIEISKKRFPGNELYVQIKDIVPFPDKRFDAVFTACVFHHIPREDHAKWIFELKRVIRPEGVLAIYEHNPLNPLTVRAVRTCPIDVNARLIRAGTMKKLLVDHGWRDTKIEYKLFFPASMSSFRFLERHIRNMFFGAQWRITGKK